MPDKVINDETLHNGVRRCISTLVFLKLANMATIACCIVTGGENCVHKYSVPDSEIAKLICSSLKHPAKI